MPDKEADLSGKRCTKQRNLEEEVVMRWLVVQSRTDETPKSVVRTYPGVPARAGCLKLLNGVSSHDVCRAFILAQLLSVRENSI